MSFQPIKFYQTGTHTVGNRLLPPETRSVQANMRRTNSLNSGHRACQGCGEALGARYAIDAAMHATNNQLIAANATGCLEVFSTPYPETSWQIPWIHSLFGNAAAVATGIAAALKVKGRSDVRVIAQGGDGGTTDIGFGCLSGMFERNDDVLYLCYDNEAYMNTGVQRSSATPPAARTATTPAVGDAPGNVFGKGKDMPAIAIAHGIPYVATATVSELRDLEAKVRRAMEFRGARYAVDAAMRATNNQLIAANATGCLEVFSTPYPETSWQLPWIHSLFGNAAAVGTGIAAALKVKGKKDVRVIAQGGDGGTTDIGFGCLSGMFERNDDVLYICYDNEAYMNTGVQRSSATPPAARTATTMAVGPEPGAAFGQGKNLPLIAMAHEIPYVATATVADLHDLEAKVEKAMSVRGARYLHVLVPCPLGWGAASHDTIRLARLARETGIFPVFEAEHGEVTRVTKIRRPVPVQDYLKPQKRFAHLFGQPGQPEMLARIQASADRNIRRFGLLEEEAV